MQIIEHPPCFELIQFADRKTHMDKDIITNHGLGHTSQADFPDGTAETHPPASLKRFSLNNA